MAMTTMSVEWIELLVPLHALLLGLPRPGSFLEFNLTSVIKEVFNPSIPGEI